MKIFKNRGEYYISKFNHKSSREERILLILLAVVVLITVVFFGILGAKYSSVKEFFADGTITTTQVEENEEDVLPNISGKRNFLVLETDENETNIHYIFLVEADRDNVAYKVCTLSPNMDIDGTSIYKIYSSGGGAALQTQLTSYLGIDIDYYASFKEDDFVEFINKLGSFIYESPEKIKYTYEEDENDTYSVKINEGEEKLSGTELSELLRYYSNEGQNFEQANQLVLYALTGLFNEDNYENNESLFRLFISATTTNITVRNFQDNIESLEVFCKTNSQVTVYSVVSQYDENNVIDANSVSEIKGYFTE